MTTEHKPHSRVWFSPHGTEWEAETYEEALEMERDSLIEQLEAEGQYRATAERDIADLERERDRLWEAVRVCGRHLYDCCRTDIDWKLQMETHNQAVNAAAWAEHNEAYPTPDLVTMREALQHIADGPPTWCRDHASDVARAALSSEQEARQTPLDSPTEYDVTGREQS